jgi:hypothetical protein
VPPPSFQEALISQIPALRTLQQLGFTYRSPEECAVKRNGRLCRVIPAKVLAGRTRAPQVGASQGERFADSEGAGRDFRRRSIHEIFPKRICKTHGLRKSGFNRPATPLASPLCAPGRVLYFGGLEKARKRGSAGGPQMGHENPALRVSQWGAQTAPLQGPSVGEAPTFP